MRCPLTASPTAGSLRRTCSCHPGTVVFAQLPAAQWNKTSKHFPSSVPPRECLLQLLLGCYATTRGWGVHLWMVNEITSLLSTGYKKILRMPALILLLQRRWQKNPHVCVHDSQSPMSTIFGKHKHRNRARVAHVKKESGAYFWKPVMYLLTQNLDITTHLHFTKLLENTFWTCVNLPIIHSPPVLSELLDEVQLNKTSTGFQNDILSWQRDYKRRQRNDLNNWSELRRPFQKHIPRQSCRGNRCFQAEQPLLWDSTMGFCYGMDGG